MSQACQADASWYSDPGSAWGGGTPKEYSEGVNMNSPSWKRVREIAEAHRAKREADQLITWSEEANR